MGSFVAYSKLKESSLKRIAKESIKGINTWFEKNPKKQVCKAELWYGINCEIKRSDLVHEIINKILENTIKSDREDKCKFAKRP